MSDKRESIRGVEALVATVSTGSFTQAASHVGMTSSGVAKTIMRLEQRLGVQLLQRTTRAMHMTSAGELYYERGSRLLVEIDTLERELAGHQDHPQGRIVLTAPRGLAGELLVPVVIAFRRRYPEVAVAVELTDRIVDLVAGSYDVAIRITDRPPESYVARKLADDLRTLCASPGYLQGRGPPVCPADLLHHDCIVHSTPAGAEPWHVRRELDGAVASFAAPSLLAFNDIAAVHQAVLAGLGIANLPTYAVADDLAAGRLISLLGPYVPVQRAIYAIYAASRPVPVNVRAFLQVLEATFPIYRARAIATTVPAPGEPESPAPGALAHRLVRSVDPTAAPSGRAAAGPRAAPEKRECVGGMEALVATVRTGSFAQAGASIGMTSSGVAKAIARLERRLGLQILQRTTRTMHMTAAGELYYKRASRLLAEIDDLEHGLGDPAIAREPAIAASRATTTARARSG